MLAVARAGEHFQMWIETFDPLCRACGDLGVVSGHDEVFGLADFGGVQHFGAHRVAVEHRRLLEGAGHLDGVDRGVEGNERDLLRTQDARDDLAHAAHADDHHPRRIGLDVLVLFRYFTRGRRTLEQACAGHQQQRRGGHR